MNHRLTEFLNTLKISRFILLALFFTLIFGFFSSDIKDPDFWWHLKSGEYICETGSLPATDPFSYTSLPKDPIKPESPRIRFILTQYWLAQVLFYRIYDFFSFQGIIFLRAFLLSLLVFLVYRSIRKEGLSIYLSAGLIIPLEMILRSFTGERPQLFSFLFAFLLIYLIEGFRRKETCGDSSGRMDNNSPLEKGDKGGCSTLHKELWDSGADKTEGDKGEGEILSEDHPHPRIEYGAGSNPPPSMGREMPSQSVSTGLNQSRRVPSLIYLLPIPLIMLLWANMHGGFIVGILIILAYMIAEPAKYLLKRIGQPLSRQRLKLLMVFGIGSVALTLVNPNGYNIVPFLIEFESGLYQSFIIESASPVKLLRMNFFEMQTIIYFILLGVTVLLFLIRIREADLSDVLLTAGLALMSLSASRAIPFFCAVSIVMIARYGKSLMNAIPLLERLRSPGRLTEISLNIAISAVIILILIYGNMFQSGVRAHTYPEGAAKFLKENRIEGNMFNPYTWGGYLMWSLYPDYKVFSDGRGLIEEVFFQQVKIMEASPKSVEGMPEWKAIMSAYRVNFIITYSVANISGRLVRLIPALLKDPEWHLIFMDNISLIFLRETPVNREMIERFGIPKEWLWNEVAVEAALKAKSYPWNINYYITMGDAFYAKGSYAEAKNAYQKAIERDPQNSEAIRKLKLLRSFGY